MKIVYFITKNNAGEYSGHHITGTFNDGKRGLRGEIPGIVNAVCCGYGSTVAEARDWAIRNGRRKGVVPAESTEHVVTTKPTAPAKPSEYGRVAVYWHSGGAQKTEEFDFSDEANIRFAELQPLHRAGQLAKLEPRYLVADVAFDDGRVYTYFVKKAHRVGTKLLVETRDGVKTVSVVRAAYWATRDQLAAKCEFGRYKVAWPTKHHLVANND